MTRLIFREVDSRTSVAVAEGVYPAFWAEEFQGNYRATDRSAMLCWRTTPARHVPRGLASMGRQNLCPLSHGRKQDGRLSSRCRAVYGASEIFGTG